MTVTPLKHVVFIAGPNWSHLRGGIKFSTNLAEKFPNAYVSIYTFAPLVAQANAYLATLSGLGRERARIVPSVLDLPLTSPLDALLSVERSFGAWILEQLAIPSFEVNSRVVAPPSCIIEDHINGGIALTRKEEHNLPVVSWWPATVASMMAHIGNPEHGHGGRLLDSVAAALAKQKPGAEESIEGIFRQELSDRVVCIPGLPPYYEHEQIPHLVAPLLLLIAQLQGRWNNMRDHIDIVAINSTYEMEPIAAEACATAFTKPVHTFCVGPGVDLPTSIPAEPEPTIDFLDKAYADLGPHSVVYAAFGTMLVFALSSPQAQLGDEFKEKMTKGGNVIFPAFTNQLKVLEHSAIHYFLSHGGWNSTTEAIVRDVPMIFWPVAGDQPTNAMQVAAQLDCGFELVQIRTSTARTKAYPDTPIVGSDKAIRPYERK